MNQEAFISWALDDARTLEERFTVEILIEDVLPRWHGKHQTGFYEGWQARGERDRQRFMNPAYVPGYTEENLRRVAEVLPEYKSWNISAPYQKRPLRDLAVVKFLTGLEELVVGGSEIADLTPVCGLPNLRVLHFGSSVCEDYRPLARCRQLRTLGISPQMPWPELAGLEQLQQLEALHLSGNLLAFAPGLVWPRVRQATLNCTPLAQRSVRDLPQLPACEFLTLGGVHRLDGIGAFPKLRNLTLTGPVRDFAPLTALQNLTWFSYAGGLPLDVAPIARLPRLLFAGFQSHHNFGLDTAKPRDYLPLTDAPRLRELAVTGCPPVDAEVATLNTVLAPWDDLLLLPQARPLPPLRFHTAPVNKIPRTPDDAPDPEDNGLPDAGVRACEIRWVGKFLDRCVVAKLPGHPDWGTIISWGSSRSLSVTVTSFAVVEKLPLIIEALRGGLARLRHEYSVNVSIHLKAPAVKPTPAQIELEEKFWEQQDKEDYETRHREQQEYLQRLYRYELKKQAGEKVDPKEFAVPPTPRDPPPPPENEFEEDDETGDDGDGDVALKKPPTPPPSWFDDEHPLAGEYMMAGFLKPGEFWVYAHFREIASYLLGRTPDLEIPEDPK